MSKAPYYAVIFTSVRTSGDQGYDEMAQQMLELATQQPGFIGVESAREEIGITVSYWQSKANTPLLVYANPMLATPITF